jgi:DNA-binding NtrC family response regulator
VPSSDRTRTLLVDADPERRAHLERLLADGGHEVSAVADADAALRAAVAAPPDLVLVALQADPGVALVGLSGAFHTVPRAAAEPGTRGGRASLAAGRPTLAALERRYALEILRETGGNKTRAAEILGIDRKTLYRLIEDCRANGATPEPAQPPTPPAS